MHVFDKFLQIGTQWAFAKGQQTKLNAVLLGLIYVLIDVGKSHGHPVLSILSYA
jgi:hypothetical protein